MHFNEVFIVSGDSCILIHKSFRLNADEKAKDTFLNLLKGKGSSQPPHFQSNGIYFYNIRRGGLYFVATSGHEISPIMVMEILSRLYSIIKDFCGTVTEASVQTNNLLILEILNEFADFGYVQIATTEKLQPYIQSHPVILKQTRETTSDLTSRVFGIETIVSPGSPVRSIVTPPIAQDSRKNELFVDIIEKLTGTVNANGTTSRLEVAGNMIMKNFVSGSPQIKIALNEDLTILEGKSKAYGSNVQLEKCNFHQCVKLEEFEKSKVVTVIPPAGEFSVMTYSTSGEITLNIPFRIMAFLDEEVKSRDKVLTLRVKNELPSNYNAVKVSLKLNVPHCINRISQQLNEPDQTAEFLEKDKQITWTIKRFPGKAEYIAYFRLIPVNNYSGQIKKEDIGPVLMDFEISGYTSSGLQIKSLKVQEMGKKISLNKWIRLITVSDSYMIKLW